MITTRTHSAAVRLANLADVILSKVANATEREVEVADNDDDEIFFAALGIAALQGREKLRMALEGRR